MMDEPTSELEKALDGGWDGLIEAAATGKVSILEIMHAGRQALWKEGDHEGYVTATRALHVMFTDKRIQKQYLVQLKADIERMIGDTGIDQESYRRDIEAKDGFRLFGKLPEVQEEAYADAPRLIAAGHSFRDALASYHRLVAHVEAIWNRACAAYNSKDFPLAVATSILAIEEIGKMGRIWYDLLGYDQPDPQPPKKAVARKHPQKHFLAVIPGALINARLDRILGAKQVKRVLQDAEGGALERLRQSCLYVDVINGNTVLPEDIITEDQARFYTILAGELWAEVLGHFPWEFTQMLAKVIDYEKSIGMSDDLIKP